MTQDQDISKQGRRALFTGAGGTPSREASIPVSEIEQAVQQIVSMEEETPEDLPENLKPVVARLLTLKESLEEQKRNCSDLESRLLLKSEQISDLQTENMQLSSERETYLNDLITSHTEFDRALEIFQYHEVPMVLTGPARTVHDANDTFCTLFSIARSDITTSHPPLDSYFFDEHGIDAPDGEHYAVVTLTPPIVPFDNEATSLIVLIKTDLLPSPEFLTEPALDTGCEEEVVVKGSPDERSYAFEQLPFPAVILNEYRTIIACNDAFCSLLGRTKESVRLRDIGSCGLRFEDSVCISSVIDDSVPKQCEAIVTLPNGSEEQVFLSSSALSPPSDQTLILIVGIATSDDPVVTESPPVITKSSTDSLIVQMLLDLNPSAVALLDRHARIVTANEGFSEMTGLSPGDLSGTDVRDLGVGIPDEILSAQSVEVRYLAGAIRMESAWGMQESSGVVACLGESADPISVILILQPISDNQPAPIATSDVPTREPEPAREPAAIPTAKSLIECMDSLPVPGIQSDLSGKIVTVNEAFLKMSGSDRSLLQGQMKNDFFSVDDSGFIRLATPSKTLILRELPGEMGLDGLKTYWYQDLSLEKQQISSLEQRIRTLEIELSRSQNETNSKAATNATMDGAAQIDIVEFELHEERYAIDIRMVREVVEMQLVTPLPRTPPYVIGIINLRGEVTHVIDLAILLGQRPRKDRSGQKIIIIPSDVTNGEHVGIIVDNVQSVTEIMGRNVSLLGDDITSQINTHIKGIIKISRDDILEKHTEGSGQNASLIIWLDIQKILHDIQGTS